MKNDIHMILKVDIDRPFHKSSGIINYYLWEALTKAGHTVKVFPQGRPSKITHGERLIQLNEFALLHRIAIDRVPDITLYCGQGLITETPKRRSEHKNVVFLHGLRGYPGILVCNPAIDLYCCNSNYLKAVLLSIMLFPDFVRRSVLDPRGAQLVTSIALPVPLLDYPSGYDNEGVDLPLSVRDALQSNSVIGHSVQRDKPSPLATCMIMRELNQQAGDSEPAMFKLVISEDVLPEITAEIQARWPDQADKMLQWFIAVPLLNNTALITLMRRSAFGLCYNRYPESFGIYPLESVVVGCPIYTNGIGNNRRLLPAGHGINVIETIDMAFHDVKEFHHVADRIRADLQYGEGRVECGKGAEYIAATHNREVFERNVETALSRLEREPVSLHIDFDALIFELSPLVRAWQPITGRVVSDFKSGILTEHEIDIVCTVLGQPASVVRPDDTRLIEKLYTLFYRGILALRPADG